MSRRLAFLSTLALMGIIAALLPAWPGAAAPAPTVPQVRARLNALTITEEKVTERYDAATVSLQRAQLTRARLDRQIASLAGEVASAQQRFGRLAAAAYESGGGLQADLAVLTSTGPQAIADRANDLAVVSRLQALAAQQLAVALRGLRASRVVAQATLRAEEALQRQLDGDRSKVEATIAAEQALLSRLTAAAQASVAPSGSVTTVAMPQGSGAAEAAVRFAYAQLGKPYQWGAAGPGAYDCSGLTMASWAAGGVSLPHSSQDQQAMLPAVAPNQLRPGDLIFFGSPAYHVGIYIGSGDMIDAPHSGTVVQINPISGYTSAGRP